MSATTFNQLMQARSGAGQSPPRLLVVGNPELARKAAGAGLNTAYIAHSHTGSAGQVHALQSELQGMGVHVALPGVWPFWAAMGSLANYLPTRNCGWSQPTWDMVVVDTDCEDMHPRHWAASPAETVRTAQMLRPDGLLAFREMDPARPGIGQSWQDSTQSLATLFLDIHTVELDGLTWTLATRNHGPAQDGEAEWLQP